MADLLPPVVAVLLADLGGFSSGMGTAVKQMGSVEGAATKMATVGKAAFLGLGVATIGFSVAAVKMASSFDQQMERIHTQAGVAQNLIKPLSDGVLKLAGQVGQSPDSLAQALYHVESSFASMGITSAKALDITKVAAQGAAIGGANLVDVTNALDAAIASGIPGVQNYQQAMGVLNATVGAGDMQMQDLADALGTGMLATVKGFGLSITDVGAALATFGDNNIRGAQAGTALRMSVQALAAPVKGGAALLADWGMKSDQLAKDMQSGGLMKALTDLKKHMDAAGISAEQQGEVITKIFGKKAGTGINVLMSQYDRVQSKYADLAKGAGQFGDAWASQQKQFAQQMHQLGAEVQVLGIKLGNFLIPKLQAMASWLAKHIGVVKILAVAIGGVLVAAIATWTAAVIENTIAMLADPATWIILAIIAAVALLAVGIYELVTHWKTVWAWIKRIALDVWHWLVDAWHATWNAIKGVVMWIQNNIIRPIAMFFEKYLVAPIKFYLKILVDVWKFAWGFLSVIFSDFMKIITFTWHLLKTNIIDPAVSWLTAFYQWIDATFVKPLTALFNRAMRALELEWHYFLVVINTVKGWLLDFWHWVDNTIIHPIVSGFDWLASQWSRLWNGIKSVLSAVWHDIKPIFDAISGAIHAVTSGLSAISHDPTGAGKALAHMLPGFASGGWVPGSPGQAQLAVVHGGEYVLSQDMIASMRASSGSNTYPFGGNMRVSTSAASGGYVPIVVNLGGTQMATVHAQLIPAAQRYKLRTGTTGLA